jgi:hypothetical protein
MPKPNSIKKREFERRERVHKLVQDRKLGTDCGIDPQSHTSEADRIIYGSKLE